MPNGSSGIRYDRRSDIKIALDELAEEDIDSYDRALADIMQISCREAVEKGLVNAHELRKDLKFSREDYVQMGGRLVTIVGELEEAVGKPKVTTLLEEDKKFRGRINVQYPDVPNHVNHCFNAERHSFQASFDDVDLDFHICSYDKVVSKFDRVLNEEWSRVMNIAHPDVRMRLRSPPTTKTPAERRRDYKDAIRLLTLIGDYPYTGLKKGVEAALNHIQSWQEIEDLEQFVADR